MRAKPLQCIFGSLALLGTVHGGVTPVVECTVQAWVRAPDLVPNTIVQGDAKVKISADCPAVDSVSLGLRFKERSFVKALRSREDVKRLHPRPANFNFMNASPWPSLFVNRADQEAYEELLANKDLWFIREEERAVFETTQPFGIGIGNHGVLRDAVQDFAILVPSTNFPPAFERTTFGVPGEQEIADVEWIYEYFAQIVFSNGTTKDISAGYTAFQPAHDPANAKQGPSSATVELESQRRKGDLAENAPIANYTIEITADSGLTFVAGTKSHVVNAVVTRTGLARAFSVPLNIHVCVTPDLSPKWAVEYGMSDGHLNLGFAKPSTVLRTTLDSDYQAQSKGWRSCPTNRATVMMSNATLDEIQAGEIVTTTSAEFTIPIQLDDAHVTDFDTYYETLSNSLSITLQIPWAEDVEVDPDDPLSERGSHFGGHHSFEEDEEAWVPWERSMSRMPSSYSGSVSIAVHPAGEVSPPQHCLPSSTPVLDQVVLSAEMVCEQFSPVTHYLDEGARGPTFVDHSAIQALLAEDPAERDLRAPILKPVVFSPPEGEELVYRYHLLIPSPWKQAIYVGKTWAKRVAKKDLVPAEVSHGPVSLYQAIPMCRC